MNAPQKSTSNLVSFTVSCIFVIAVIAVGSYKLGWDRGRDALKNDQTFVVYQPGEMKAVEVSLQILANDLQRRLKEAETENERLRSLIGSDGE